MSRIVKAKATPAKGLQATAASDSGANPTKEALERIAKYIPAEIIAAFTAINGGLLSLPANIQYWALLVNLIICAVFTPIYFKLMATPTDPKNAVRVQQLMSFIAFLIWAYSVTGENGIFGKPGFNMYYAGLASGFITLFTLVSGAVIPRIKKETI
jgi:Na+-transporting NADH:ubiquinone oxidoreductase subunit NqrB